MHLSVPSIYLFVIVYNQYDVCKYYVGSGYVGGYGGLSENVRVSYFVVRRCAVSRRYINVCMQL